MPENAYTLRYVNDFPEAPDLDYSWHPLAACKDDPEAMRALEQVGFRAQRPWEPWCGTCPVKLHCLQQGLQEDEMAPNIRGGKHQPMVYGGLTPLERRRDGRRQLKGLPLERQRLRKKRDAASA